MEEFVGKHWHRFITRRVDDRFPDAAVTLEQTRSLLSILFRAFGGEGGLKIEAAQANEHGARRSWLQKLAGTHKERTLAWLDNETLRLPAQLDYLPDQQLNRQLYHWLAALAAIAPPTESEWFYANQQRTLAVLHRFPGLHKQYRTLVGAHLTQRPSINKLPADEAAQEQAIRQALLEPGSIDTLPEAKRPPHPVPLWLHPHPPISQKPLPQSSSPDHNDDEPEGHSKEGEQEHKYRAQRTEMPDGKDGILTMRWENIFSWGEYIKVNRCSDEDDDDNAAETAKDMQQLHVAQDQQTSTSRIRLDLDLPSAEYDDLPLSSPITLPEWDWKKEQLLNNHCSLQLMEPRDSQPRPLPEHLRREAYKLRQQFSALQQNRTWQRAQQDGSELDMQAYLDFVSARHQGEAMAEKGLYRALRIQQRDLATLLLADLSLSTDAAINDQQRIIDVIQDSLLLFGEALHACGDRYALYGFSSRNRQQVRFYRLKEFGERYSNDIRGRLQAIRPGYYTRMGAAIRYASELLSKQANSQRLMIILTDGKPNDLDKYEGRYGVEDTRMAIHEAKQLGLIPFCITIDREGDSYLPYLFGSQGYTVIQRPEQLPQRLLSLYSQLTQY